MRKYLFIDTNIYKYLFNENSTFSKEIVDLIMQLLNKNKLILLLPEQVKDEVERNHLEKWYIEEIDNRNKKFNNYKENINKKIESLESFEKIKRELRKEIDKEEKRKEKDIKDIKLRYRDKKSESIKNFENLKDNANIINTTKNILDRSDIRNKKHNPPYDKEKLTDAIIWESLLDFMRNEKIIKSEKIELYFIADDKRAWGQEGFNPFLLNELLKIKTNLKIIHRQSIQCLGELFSLDVKNIKEEEDNIIKNNIINVFCGSTSWQSAGTNFAELLKYKNSFNYNDFEKIINASIANPQIYNSFYVNLNILFENEKNEGFLIDIVDKNVDDDIWNIFKQKNSITLSREKDQLDENSQNIDNIPF